MNLRSEPNSIPLHCNICTKKPDFSDISHLLTHVASKSHLSNYYRTKVQGTADVAAKSLVDEYDQWYDDYNIDDLMRERMSQKSKRKGSSGPTVSRRGSAGQSRRATLRSSARANAVRRPAPPASSRGTPAAMPTARRTTRHMHDSLLNPRLDRDVKGEPKSRSATPTSVLSFNGSLHRAYAPPMQSWPTTPYADTPMKVESLASSFSNDSFELEPEPEPRRPLRRSTRRTLSDSNPSLLNDDEWEMDETTSDAAKLKGVLWPGMAMFDSATPDMKRKRNQKKDYSVIEQLKATSEFVEPNEMIFDRVGNLRKQREITGNPDPDGDESPLSGEVTPEPELPLKKRPARRPRQALVDKDVNAGRVLRRRSSHHPPPGNRSGPYYDGPVEDDDDLTYGQSKPRKRSGLSIHRDNSGPEITFNDPAPLNYLTSSFRNPFQPTQSQVQHAQPTYTQNNFGRSHQRLPSFTLGGQGYGGSFRPATSSHNMPTQDFGSFGHLNNNALFSNNPFPVQNGHSAFASFQQHVGIGQQQSFGGDNTMFQNHNQNSLGGWDVFAGLGQQDTGAVNNVDAGFNVGTELNPLFFSSNQPTPPEDDEATVSPPVSERAARC